MVTRTEQFREVLAKHKLVAIIRCAQAGAAEKIGRTLLDAGVELLEVTLTTPDALEAITALRGVAGPNAWVGAGSVITAADVDRAAAAGAQFLVTPALSEGVFAAASADIPVLAGAFTATEVVTAWQAGVAAVKIFPARTVGPGYLKALRDPLPQIPLVPVGGVSLATLDDWFAAGAFGVGVGSPLIGDASAGENLEALAERAAAFVAALAEVTS